MSRNDRADDEATAENDAAAMMNFAETFKKGSALSGMHIEESNASEADNEKDKSDAPTDKTSPDAAANGD